MHFGERLRTLRKQARISQTNLAERLAIDTSLVSRFESGEREPSPQQVLEIARALGVSVDYLLNASARPQFILRGKKASDSDESAEVRRVMTDAEQQVHYLHAAYDLAKQPSRRFALRYEVADIGIPELPDFVDELRSTLQLNQYVSLDELKQALRDRHIHVFEWSMPLNLSGLSYRGGFTVIIVNREHGVGRRLFTLAHELAHVMFHFEKDKDEAGMVSLYSHRGDTQEKQANQLAAELLMPKRIVTESVSMMGRRIKTIEGLESLAQRFNVSRDAMFYRLAEQGVFRWSERSRYFSAKHDSEQPLPKYRVTKITEQVSPEFLRYALDLVDDERISAGKLSEWLFAGRYEVEAYLSQRFFEDEAYIV